MKIFKLMAVALVAMVALNSCSEDCDHEFIEMDYTNDLVGTWTCLEEDYAEAIIINADGSAVSTGYDGASSYYWEDVKGTVKAVNNKVTMIFEDDDNFEGSFDLIPGEVLSLVDATTGERTNYYYCKEDLADEVVGMWVCTNAFTAVENDMLIQTFNEDGTSAFTGYVSEVNDFVSEVSGKTYKVIGDLVISIIPDVDVAQGLSRYTAMRLTYAPNGTEYGDIMIFTHYLTDGKENSDTWLRISQSLSLAEKKYDYSNLYLSNVKGKDKDINFWGYTMNLAKMDGSGIDKMLKAILFHMEFPDAKTLSYTYTIGTNQETYSAPIEVEGNKLTVKMSQRVPTLKDVVFYAFQDAKDSQLHLYMHRDSFVNFYTNMQAMLMIIENPQFDITNAEAIEAIYNNINDAVETINLSIIMK